MRVAESLTIIRLCKARLLRTPMQDERAHMSYDVMSDKLVCRVNSIMNQRVMSTRKLSFTCPLTGPRVRVIYICLNIVFKLP